MKISIITSCTGDKTVSNPDQLTQKDFEQGESHVRRREAALAACMRPAGMLYAGEQHVRLMRGVEAAREQGAEISVSILSAGYGVVKEAQMIAPYEMTFNTMKKTGKSGMGNHAGHLGTRPGSAGRAIGYDPDSSRGPLPAGVRA